MSLTDWLAIVVGVLLAVAWYLSYSAARLDRLHTRVEGALSALDAQLVRRAEAALELANSRVLDPASSMILAGAASECLESQNEQATEDLLDGATFGERESIESDLTTALDIALPADVVEGIRTTGGYAEDAFQRVLEASRRVNYARRFHNSAVADVRRVRSKWVVRLFRLAGHAALPSTIEFDDSLPSSVGD
jgi:hypothetical protein